MFNITNYSEHPTNSNYIVFRFVEKEQSLMFKNLLEMDGIPFESDEDDSHGHMQYMIAVKNQFESKAVYHNFTVIGHHREPFISNVFFRYLFFAIALGALSLAFYGYFTTTK